MKAIKKFLPVFFVLMTVSTYLTAQTPAQKGETVWIITNYIKDGSKLDFEKWMTDVFFTPMKTTKDPILEKQYKATRWLTPVQQNVDKTWTYVFLMDPVIPNGDYDIESYLIRTYGEQKGKDYRKQFENFLATEGKMYVLKQ